MVSITSLFKFIVFLIAILLAACSDTASQTSNPDVADDNVSDTSSVVAQPLLAPTDLTVSTENGVVTLDWSEVSADNTNGMPTYDIYWNIAGNVTVSDTKVENVTSPHTVKGLLVGKTYYFIITTVDDDAVSDVSFEVFAKAPPPILISIDLIPANASGISNSTVQMFAMGTFSDGNIINMTSAVNWSSADLNFASIDDQTNKGLLTAKNIGTTTIAVLDPIRNINGSTSFRTQIDHAVFGSPLPSCNNNGCHSSLDWPVTHPASTQQCDACHIPLAEPFVWKFFIIVDHNEVIGSCLRCHDGTTFKGKPITHISSSDMCEACHIPDTDPATPDWLVVAVDHAQVLGSCVSCHDGVIAIGKKVDVIHANVNDDCNACHTSLAFRPVKTTDHTTVNSSVSCVTCHDGINARSKGGLHIASGDVCEDCHIVSGWLN